MKSCGTSCEKDSSAGRGGSAVSHRHVGLGPTPEGGGQPGTFGGALGVRGCPRRFGFRPTSRLGEGQAGSPHSSSSPGSGTP